MIQTKNKLLLIISGEFFRQGNQGSRLRDTPESIEMQKKAIETHIKFIKHIKQKYQIDFDIQILSYKSEHQDFLKTCYGQHNLVDAQFYDYYFPDRTQLVNSSKIDNVESKYDSILVIRPDMILKDMFIEIFDPFANKICYPSMVWTAANGFYFRLDASTLIPRINDTMLFIPNIYFQRVYYKIGLKLYHEGMLDYVKEGLSIHMFDFFVKTMHDSDPFKDYNPLYSFSGRPATKNWYSYGYEIRPYDFFPLETNNKPNFKDWNLFEDGISVDKFNQIQNFDNLWEWWHHYVGYNKFINIIELDFKNPDQSLRMVSPTRHPNETFYSIKDNYKLCFYDANVTPTSILYKKNANEFHGKSLINDDYFTLKKI